jgi:hypothetical protein
MENAISTVKRESEERWRELQLVLSDIPMAISNSHQAITANDLLKNLKKDIKFFEANRVTEKMPIIARGKAIDDFYKSIMVPLENAEAKLKKCLIEFKQEEEKKAREQEEKILQASLKEAEDKRRKLEEKAHKLLSVGREAEADHYIEKASEVIPMPIMTAHEATSLSGSSIKTVTVLVIDDINQIPKDLYINNADVQKAIQKALQPYAKNKVLIKGVRYVDEYKMSTRTGE